MQKIHLKIPYRHRQKMVSLSHDVDDHAYSK